MNDLNEELLDAWLNLSAIISNERMVSYMSFNEAFVCHLLYRALTINPKNYLTATDLCQKTRMLKSQMNKTLNTLEQKGLIKKIRSTTDKRVIHIALCEDKLNIYQNEHQHILSLIDRLIEKLGDEYTVQTVQILTHLAQTFNQLINEGDSNGNKNNN